MPRLKIGNHDINYTVTNSSRAKSIRIAVDACSGVVVTVPKRYQIKDLDHILTIKAGWIYEQLQSLSELAGCCIPRSYDDGDKYFYLGQKYPLRLVEGVGAAGIVNGELIVPNTQNYGAGKMQAVRRSLLAWYRQEACDIIMPRTKYYVRNMGVNPSGIRIKDQKTCWGSCTGRGTINLNLKLVMAPIEVIDYVIVHELCHLIKRDHSKGFWDLVGSVMPDFSARRSWLKKHSPVLNF